MIKTELSRTQELVYELDVAEVMNRDLVTVTPTTGMAELREILKENRISGVPVLEHNSLVGLISLEDFIDWLASSGEDCPVRDRMTTDVVVLHEDSPVVTAIEKFEQYNFGRFPVIEPESERLTGIVTKGDIVEGLLRKLEVDYHQEEKLKTYRASHIFDDVIADRKLLKFQYYVEGRDLSQAGESSSSLKKTLKRLGFPAEIVRRVAIAIYEAEMNIVIFADKGRISVEVGPEKIKIKVRDTGPGIEDIERAMQPGFSTAEDWAREMGFGAGMGLPNIKQCSDEFKLNSREGRGTQLDVIISVSDPEKIEGAEDSEG